MTESQEIDANFTLKEYLSLLDEIDASNLKLLIFGIKRKADELQIKDVHLFAVGGTTDVSRQEEPHKDIDLVLIAPKLATTNDSGGVTGFDSFATFVGDSLPKGWVVSKVNEPYFDGWEHSGDGSIIVSPPNGKPFDILPTRENTASLPLKDQEKALHLFGRPAVLLS